MPALLASATRSCWTPTPTRCRRCCGSSPRGSSGDEDVSIDHYISREWFEREKERLWARVWQMACREEHIPRPGDYTLYEIVGKSFLIVRVDETTIKAYPNACLHRGRQLKQYDGRCEEIRCPFHGFAWNPDGSLKDVPAAWDLPHVTPEKLRACPR